MKNTKDSFFFYNHINILHQNISGLINKSDELILHLDELKKEKGKIVDIICVTEHNMIPEIEEFLTIPNYALASSFSRKKKRGGACILARKNLQYKVLEEIKNLSIECIVECCGIEICKHNMIVVCMYRVPNTNRSSLDMFHETLERILNIICDKKSKKVVICGDFNIDILKDNPKSRDFTYQLDPFMQTGTNPHFE